MSKKNSKRSSVATRHATVHGDAFAHSISKQPVLQILKTTARTVTLSWMFHPENCPPHGTPIQIVKAEGTDPQFSRAYEGTEDYFVVENLKPETLYRFKLRIWDKNIQDYGSEYVEVSTTTTDESKLIKIQLKLYRAVAENNVEVFKELMEENRSEINVEMRDKNGKTMLMQAALKGSAEMVAAILEYGALQTTTTQSKKTPLSLAVTYSNLPAVTALLKDPHAINIADQGGSTPLMWAVEHANFKNGLEIVRLLLDSGADISAEDVNGLSAMDRLCASCGNAKCARMLLEHGAKIVNRIDPPKKKVTTLMMAALNGHKELCYELIDNWSADVWAKTEFGQTAKMMAEGAGHVDLGLLLEKKMIKEDY
ncbi:Ankyrin repeat A protein 2 [Rhizoclosmatium sp. JEL0117]|nr:Ankyrin repeat A protein 2 [Rhizoclosmatium sp. JEL0117]